MLTKLEPMKTSIVATLLALFSLSMVAGCGGSSGSCGKVQPCGGSITGTWKMASTCVSSSSFTSLVDPSSFCAQATVAADVQFSGTATFGADMTFSEALTESGSVTLILPPACLMSGGITLTCEQFDQGFQQQFQMNPDPMIQSVKCTSAGSNCNCKVVVTPQPLNQSGTFATSGNTLIETPDGTLSGSYCVQGNELHSIAVDTTMPMGSMGMVKIAGDLVAQKQ